MSTLSATIGRGATGSRPAASEAGRLYYDTTAQIWYRDNGSSWDSCTPSSLTNPMTTGGDTIYGGASGSPTRLANGSANQVLTSAGGTSAPTWGYPIHTASETFATGTTTIVNTATWYDAVSTTPAAGTYVIVATADCKISGNTGFVEVRLWDGTTIFNEGEVYIAAAGGRASVALATTQVLTGSQTVKISGASTVGSSAATIEPTIGSNGTANKATKIVALRIA